MIAAEGAPRGAGRGAARKSRPWARIGLVALAGFLAPAAAQFGLGFLVLSMNRYVATPGRGFLAASFVAPYLASAGVATAAYLWGRTLVKE